jgi:hypothetical protein
MVWFVGVFTAQYLVQSRLTQGRQPYTATAATGTPTLCRYDGGACAGGTRMLWWTLSDTGATGIMSRMTQV